MEWNCKIRFIESIMGNVVADQEQLKYQIKRRMAEKKLKLTPEELKEQAQKEFDELYPVEDDVITTTFHSDASGAGLYMKDFNINGMLKEKVRRLGLTRGKESERGLISAIEDLKVTHRIYFKRPNGDNVLKPDGQIGKPILTPFHGPIVTFADSINPPVECEFNIQLSNLSKAKAMTPERLEQLLKECDRLLGLRKEYGLFEWVELKRIPEKAPEKAD